MSISGNITATGATTATAAMTGDANVSLSGFGGTSSGNIVLLERSTDAGATYQKAGAFYKDSEDVAYSAGSVLYRFNCVTYVAGTTIAYKISQ